jgi:3,4-dihydroxy-2-butanone 4-phosphate synthase
LPEDAWIDFRVSPREPGAGATINGLVAAAHKAGALFAISHPIDNCGGCSWEQVIPDGVDAVEIWQNDKAPRDAEVALWNRLLLNGRRITAVGVSDWHRPGSRIDVATVRVLADRLTQPAILDGIRQGHVVVMRDAQTEPPRVRARCGSMEAGVGDALTCSAGDELTVHVAMKDQRDGRADFIWNAARMTTRTIGRGTAFIMPAANGYLRVHLYAADGSTLAVTNPIYVAIH